MNKAEERALEVYPPLIEIYPKVPSSTVVDFKPEVRDWNMLNRQRFMEGYEQAEKDLAMTWRDIMVICEHYVDVNYEYDYHSIQEKYEEILRRFKEAKK